MLVIGVGGLRVVVLIRMILFSGTCGISGIVWSVRALLSCLGLWMAFGTVRLLAHWVWTVKRSLDGLGKGFMASILD